MERLGVYEVVSHPYFGCGRITEDCGDSWKVLFSSGKERNVLKTYERLKPEPVIYLFYSDEHFCAFQSYNALLDFLKVLVDGLEAEGVDRQTAKRKIDKMFTLKEKSVLTLMQKEA